MAHDNSQVTYPYVPFQTFEAFIRHLHETVVTDQIDNTMMPSKFSGGARAAVTSALKSLGLIDAKNNTTAKLKDLVDAYQGKNWAAKLKEHVLSTYTNIPNHFDLKSVTRKQLEDVFGDMTQQMREKSIRFFLAANKEAGIEYSTHIKMRKTASRKYPPTGIRSRKESEKKKHGASEEMPEPEETHPDMLDLPILGAPGSVIRVPQNITVNQVALIRAAVDYLAVKAKQNEEEAKQ